MCGGSCGGNRGQRGMIWFGCCPGEYDGSPSIFKTLIILLKGKEPTALGFSVDDVNDFQYLVNRFFPSADFFWCLVTSQPT